MKLITRCMFVALIVSLTHCVSTAVVSAEDTDITITLKAKVSLSESYVKLSKIATFDGNATIAAKAGKILLGRVPKAALTFVMKL